jgi:23S rRNA pseudouridine1911/1915/1917 synthase
MLQPSNSFRIVFENDHFLVVDKPAPLIVHPTKPGGEITLWNQLRQTLAFEIVNGGQISLINRLDRETSGLVLVAKHRLAARDLHTSMQRGEIEKTYQTIVFGWPEPDEFTVNKPLLRQGSVMPSRIHLRQTVHPHGTSAETTFCVLERFTRAEGKFALLRAEPKTGRTHQIRVHLSSRGHPIVGDKIYGRDETCYLRFIETGWTPDLQQQLLLSRQALHASRLEFEFRGERHLFGAPFPPDLQCFIE